MTSTLARIVGLVVVAVIALGLVIARFLNPNSQRPTPMPGVTPSAEPGVLITYQRSGGLAGLDDTLTVNSDGTALLTRRTGSRQSGPTQFTIDPQNLSDLKRLCQNADFPHLKSQYLPSAKGYDLIEYHLTYQGYTVVTADSAVPASLQPIITLLNEVIQAQNRS